MNKVGSNRVEYIGKPYKAVYDKCYASFAAMSTNQENSSNIDQFESKLKQRMCGVGDSLDHDILGANRFGITSVFTANGVHCQEIGTEEGSENPPNLELLEKLLNKFDVTPTVILSNFKW